MERQDSTPILVPLEPEDFRHQVRLIVREELEREKMVRGKGIVSKAAGIPAVWQKPIYSMGELRQLFGNVSRSTVYAWVAEGKLQPRKLKGKIYFLWEDIERTLKDDLHLPGRPSP